MTFVGKKVWNRMFVQVRGCDADVRKKESVCVIMSHRERETKAVWPTRFGEILPIKQNVKSLRPVFERYFNFCQIFEPIVAKNYVNGQLFLVVKGQILKIIWSHLL